MMLDAGLLHFGIDVVLRRRRRALLRCELRAPHLGFCSDAETRASSPAFWLCSDAKTGLRAPHLGFKVMLLSLASWHFIMIFISLASEIWALHLTNCLQWFLNSLHIHNLLADALVQMPKYAKFMKEILQNKRRLEKHETVMLNVCCDLYEMLYLGSYVCLYCIHSWLRRKHEWYTYHSWIGGMRMVYKVTLYTFTGGDELEYHNTVHRG